MLRLRVKEAAEDRGYTMTSLSRACGISFNTIKYLWTHPYAGVNIRTLEQIAKALGVRVADLFTEESDPRG